MRRVIISLLTCIPCMALCGSLLGQASTSTSKAVAPKVVKEPEAVNAVQAAVAALGGAAAIGQVQTLVIQATAQGVAPNGTNVSGSVTWEMSGDELRINSSGDRGSGTIVTGHGNPAIVGKNGNVAVPSYVMAATFIPALVAPRLLKDFNDSNCDLRYRGAQTLAKHPVNVVKMTCFDASHGTTTERTWYFDASGSLPVRVEFQIPSMKRRDLVLGGATDLSDYHSASGVQFPNRIINYRRGKQTGVITLQSVSVNTAIAASDFDAPTGGAQ